MIPVCGRGSIHASENEKGKKLNPESALHYCFCMTPAQTADLIDFLLQHHASLKGSTISRASLHVPLLKTPFKVPLTGFDNVLAEEFLARHGDHKVLVAHPTRAVLPQNPFTDADVDLESASQVLTLFKETSMDIPLEGAVRPRLATMPLYKSIDFHRAWLAEKPDPALTPRALQQRYILYEQQQQEIKGAEQKARREQRRRRKRRRKSRSSDTSKTSSAKPEQPTPETEELNLPMFGHEAQ
ncbi:MAG: hypothetical protein MHM6MM_002192 [Cercozoa sp. M6MM]